MKKRKVKKTLKKRIHFNQYQIPKDQTILIKGGDGDQDGNDYNNIVTDEVFDG